MDYDYDNKRVNKLRDKAADALDRASASARETAEAARSRVAAGYTTARANAGRLADEAQDYASEAYTAGREKAAVAYKAGKEKAEVAARKTQAEAAKQWDERPFTLVAGALAAGLIAGLTLPGRKRNDA